MPAPDTTTDLAAFGRQCYDELLNQHNLDAIGDYLADDVIWHDLPPGLPAGIAGARIYFDALLAAFPDYHGDVHTVVADDHHVAMLVDCTATHEGEFRGIAPTGRVVRWTGESHLRVEDGKAVEVWHHYNHLSVLEQIGAAVVPVATVDLVAVWEQHTHAEFVLRDPEAALATMVDEPSVSCLPVATGGTGRAAVRRFYTEDFIPAIPDDIASEVISRTVGDDRVVEEALYTFTHDREMPWFLPGLAATGTRLEVPVVGVIEFVDGKVAAERLWWDHAGVLRQLGLLPAGNAGVMQT